MRSYNDIIIPQIGVMEVQKAFKRMTEANEDLFRCNREQLLDFYLSQQTDKDEYLKEYFNRETNPNLPSDYPHNLILTSCNITSKIIDKKAKNYITQPVRKINNLVNDKYTEILLSAGIKLTAKWIDRTTWLFGDTCVVLIADEKKKKLRIDTPPYYRPIFTNDDTFNPSGVAYPIGMRMNKRGENMEMWAYWDEREYVMFEGGSFEIADRLPNVHGCFNVMFTHRMKPFRSHWTKDAQDLIDNNRDINIALTSINNAFRYQGFPTLTATGVRVAKNPDTSGAPGDNRKPDAIKIGFDKVLTVEKGIDGGSVSLDFLYPNVDWDGLLTTVKTRIELIAFTWNVNVKWEIAGDVVSGVALKIMDIDNREDMDEMQEIYEEYFEIPLYEKVQTISENIEFINSIPSGILTLDWAEPQYVETPNEILTRQEKELAMNLITPVDILKQNNPDLDDKQALELLMKNKQINESLRAVAQPKEPNNDMQE